MKNEPHLRGRRAEGFGQAAKPDTPHPQGFDGFDQLLHQPRHAVEALGPHRIAASASSVTLTLLLPVIDSPLQPLAVLVSECGSPDFPSRYCWSTGAAIRIAFGRAERSSRRLHQTPPTSRRRRHPNESSSLTGITPCSRASVGRSTRIEFLTEMNFARKSAVLGSRRALRHTQVADRSRREPTARDEPTLIATPPVVSAIRRTAIE